MWYMGIIEDEREIQLRYEYFLMTLKKILFFPSKGLKLKGDFNFLA